MTVEEDGFNAAAINAAMGRQMLKDMIGAFDTDGEPAARVRATRPPGSFSSHATRDAACLAENRRRMRETVEAANGDTEQIMLTVIPLAVDIASDTLVRWGVKKDLHGKGFLDVMKALQKLAGAGRSVLVRASSTLR